MRVSKAFVLLICSAITTLASAQKESVLIGPGDVLHVQVFDTPDLDETVHVTDAGDMPLILGGTIRVASLTPAEASRAVERALTQAQIMYQPRVLVSVVQFATQNVSVFGEVTRPGAYTIDTPRSVIDVLALAGGLTIFGDRHVTIERHGTMQQVSYVIQNNPADSATIQMLVYPGDKIIVPKVGLVYVLGDVKLPGGYPMANNNSDLTVLEAVALAGGAMSTASTGNTKLVRKTAEGGYQGIPVPLNDMQKGKKPDMPLEASDVIYVPFSFLRNAALGAIGIVAATVGAALYIR